MDTMLASKVHYQFDEKIQVASCIIIRLLIRSKSLWNMHAVSPIHLPFSCHSPIKIHLDKQAEKVAKTTARGVKLRIPQHESASTLTYVIVPSGEVSGSRSECLFSPSILPKNQESRQSDRLSGPDRNLSAVSSGVRCSLKRISGQVATDEMIS
ncbi:hypothetical protein AVEN_212209-1 [Araneus ventricosus]|uniref:Uncharacterized protein n=1 Tax=Araneus ventricosus TaxID=182803 RepID=A0A4Y2HTU3_ARAVE|nr:hypothetical protein AVEN_212209-1 [Araneus ventricosus]